MDFSLFLRLGFETDEYNKERSKYMRKLERHFIYQKYLDKVLESAEEFHEIREIIGRFDTLTATHEVSFAYIFVCDNTIFLRFSALKFQIPCKFLCTMS